MIAALAVIATPVAHAKTSAYGKSSSAKMQTASKVHGAKAAAIPKENLNTADRDELMKLPGVGEATADKIIAARPFKSKHELVSKKIVSRKEYQAIAPHVVASAPKLGNTHKS
jgi:DNA uptake protein ComE-like DNA-binding protein